MTVPIAEQFYSIQGEGPFAGGPALFLRLAGCNLCCGGYENYDRDAEDMEPEGDAEWVCDTIDVWREAESAAEADAVIGGWSENGWLNQLSKGAHLVLTGGEPMIPGNQEAISEIALSLAKHDFYPFTEVETNGTVLPKTGLRPVIDQWNVSLKLANSGMPEGKRLKDEPIEYFKQVHISKPNKDAVFKFVVTGDDPEIAEVIEIIYDYDIPDSMVMLMPAGQTQEQLRETYPAVAEVCKARGWRFSPRLHVDMWNKATGV